ncbi:hypothetical protein K0M31_015783 [Melipona bicolor]|uniref:Uncharacterized protein n=1 Tax=Melipona bicolor TaxID=60889 RepID=A0AA40KEW3_9HYME|nr:hypothetical protein K0M31_015783 [Melipona bicolor]
MKDQLFVWHNPALSWTIRDYPGRIVTSFEVSLMNRHFVFTNPGISWQDRQFVCHTGKFVTNDDVASNLVIAGSNRMYRDKGPLHTSLAGLVTTTGVWGRSRCHQPH